MCVLYQYITDHANHFSYSYPVTGVRNIYITRPKRKSISMSLWNAFFPYEPTVWIVLLMALILQSTVATLVSKLEYSMNFRAIFNPTENFWQYLRLQVHQTTEFQTPFFLQSGNLAFILYAVIQATLFTNLYTAVLLSALIQGQNPRPWDSYNEMVSLVKAREYSMVIDKLDYQEGSFLETLSFTNIIHLRNLRDAINKNPIMIARSIYEALDYVEKGGYIFPTKQDSLALQLAKERCDLFYFEDDHMQEPEFFIFSKDNPLLKEWNEAIKNNQPFIRRTFQKYFFLGYRTGRIPKCPENNYNIREASRPLDIISTFGIFLIALIGFTASFIIFCLNYMWTGKP
uniref:Ionotropic glutamate receptor C-terminal domain-containing protein n=1 Tax=Ditylenchus dipsaci TaxID=166011 RepID=A0A915DRN0_9BILA